MTSRSLVPAIAVGWVLAAGTGAGAQSFDCEKAKSTTEKAICASPALKQIDQALAASYAAVLAADPTRDPAKAGDTIKAQRQWVAERDRACAPRPAPAPPRPAGEPTPGPDARPAPPAAEPDLAAIGSCLHRQYRGRLAALDSAAVKAVAASLPSAAAEGAAAISVERVPAAGRSDALVTVTQPGRFAIRAESPTGVQLQLVDQIEGPGDPNGVAGVRDGRIDALLDVGTYKLRVVGAAEAKGEAKLSVQAYREAGPPEAGLLEGGQSSSTLADLQQRSAWIVVRVPGRVSIQAAGRALGDLRLWRNGRDLADVKPALSTVEPKAGRPLASARIDATVEPGVYRVTAYGRAPLVWADGGAGEPFHLRVGDPPLLAGGLTDGVIGPLGVARFSLPASGMTYVRLETPEPVGARLSVTGGGSTASAEITRRSREPVASVRVSSGAGRIVEVSGIEGQRFRLRALDPSTSRGVTGEGPHWVALDVAGEGADELPATVLLARYDGRGGATVLASDLPRVGPSQAWRRRFNLRGPSNILFEATGPTPLAVRAEGVGVQVAIEPLLGRNAPRADGKVRNRWDLEPGWYSLRLDPVNGAMGVLDLTLGPPGLAAEPQRQTAARTTIPFGIQTLEKAGGHVILANASPALVAGPVVRAFPANLATAPLTMVQAPGQPLDVQLRLPAANGLRAVEGSGENLPLTVLRETLEGSDRIASVRIPPIDRARTVSIWSPAGPAEAPPRFEQPADLELVQAGRPRFFDLARDAQRSFALDVPEGGLYRVETLGRLQTKAAIATSFLPNLASDEAGGRGENALVSGYLRAGRYRVQVQALESNGRAGLLARPAEMRAGDRLLPGGSVRASLEDGAGVAFPVEIGREGTYKLEVLGLTGAFEARLEDEEGWPIVQPGSLDGLERTFEPGRYRLVVLPAATDSRVVVRLAAIEKPARPEGHGPHPLPFDVVQGHQWREPPGRDDARAPDVWTFALQGPADVVLDIGDGMVGELKREGAGGDAPLARIVAKNGFSGRLEAGRYAVEARSLGRNDRLDYTLSLRSKELQPGRARAVTLPVTVPFALAEDRVVNLTTFGSIDVRGVLRDGSGRVVERFDDRADDWNLAVSRRLQAGSYTLELSALPGQQRGTESSGDGSSGEASSGEAPADGAEPASDAADDARPFRGPDEVEVLLALPAEAEPKPLAFQGAEAARGPQVHRFALQPAGEGKLLAAAARGDGEVVLALERQAADGRWETRGLDRGRAPVVAAPAESGERPWRLSAWAVDGGPAEITVAARAVSRPAQGFGTVALEPVPFEGFGVPVRAALVAAPGSGLVSLDARGAALLEGSRAGDALAPAGAFAAPQSDRLWILSRTAQAVDVSPARASEGPLALALAPGSEARLPAGDAPRDAARFWIAETSFGQPGIEAGRGFGIGRGGALALSGGEPVRVFNAGDGNGLRVSLRAVDARLDAPTDLASGLRPLDPGTARALRLPPGPKRLTLALPPRTAAVAGWTGPGAVTVWSGEDPASRTLDGDWTDLLVVNLGEGASAVSAAVAPLGSRPEPLQAGRALKRFAGAAGAISVPVEAKPGDRLVTAGLPAAFVGRDGRVLRGRSLDLTGPGELVLPHEAGLVAAWIERPGLSPWTDTAPKAVEAPAVARLEGDAMSFDLRADAPRVLRVRTTAPVILALAERGRNPEPVAFPRGAEFHAYQGAGASQLRLYSPHDGPLSGTVEVTADPVTPVGEGQGEAVALAPGAAALFGFEVTRTGPVGVGIRAEPDRAEARLIAADGRVLGSGLAQLHRLEPGRYVLEARVPPDASATTVRPTVLGIAPPPAGPPAEITLKYLDMVGLAPAQTR